MPLNATVKTLNKAGESRKRTSSREAPSNASSRDHSQHRGLSTHDPVPLRGQENASGQTTNNAAALRASLAVTVPNTMKGQPSQSSDDEKENDEPYQQYVKHEPGFGPPRSRHPQYNYEQDDDNNSTSITFNSKGWEPDPDTYPLHHTAIFRGDPLASLNSPGLRSEARRAKEARSNPQRMNQSSIRPQQGRQPASYDADEFPASEDDGSSDGFEDADEARRLARDTPSRTTVAPVRKVPSRSNLIHEKKVGFADLAPRDRGSSPITNDPDFGATAQIAGGELPQREVHTHSSLARHIQTREEVKQIPIHEPPRPTAVNVNATAKVSSFDDPPPEELPNPFQPGPASTATKRTHNEIDYDLGDLKTKTYAALDELPFLTDPRAPALQAQVDATGNPLPTLSARLNNLSKMRPEDQKNLFVSLTDAENEQTGQFFIDSFSDNLKKLMQKRLERRKIALKYQLEARKRQKAIETKQKQCEDELGELKTGGNKLVEGRSVDRIGMTPRKPSAGVAGMMPPPAML